MNHELHIVTACYTTNYAQQAGLEGMCLIEVWAICCQQQIGL